MANSIKTGREARVAAMNVKKRETLRDYALRYGVRYFVETGTLIGDTIEFMLPHMDRLWTIDINSATCQDARRRFAAYPQVECLFGDSRHMLPKLLERIDQPTLFWLDAHYCGGKFLGHGVYDVPINEELVAVMKHPQIDQHIILIDDAKVFFKSWKKWNIDVPLYPEMEKIVKDVKPDWQMYIKENIVRVHCGDSADASTG